MPKVDHLRHWLAACALLWAPGVAATPVDLELVLAVDVSRSMDEDEARLQREGYVRALADPAVLRALTGGVHGATALAYVEWGGAARQVVTVDWTRIADAGDAAAFARRLEAAPVRRYARTAIGAALRFAADLFADNGFAGTRRVVDVSGDGANNQGPRVDRVRDELVARGIVVNGLPILRDGPNDLGWPVDPDLDRYYADCVVGGAGAFTLPARGFDAFAEAVRRKLVLEIAGTPPPRPLAASAEAADCTLGERLWRQRMNRVE